jgi:beta-lactamase class D
MFASWRELLRDRLNRQRNEEEGAQILRRLQEWNLPPEQREVETSTTIALVEKDSDYLNHRKTGT